MPMHDWTRVEAEIAHSFHLGWIAEAKKVLNGGLLPEGYYALIEQHACRSVSDVLTRPGYDPTPPIPSSGGLAVADSPPRTRRRHTVEPSLLSRRRSLAIRHVSGHRLIALLEILSPANKDRTSHVEEFVDKAEAALDAGIHLLLVDPFPPGPHDPGGMHGAILRRLEPSGETYAFPPDEPATPASYAAGPPIEIYLEHVAVGSSLPEMPLFLHPERYINLPLEPSYQSAYVGMPAFWRGVLEGQSATI